MVINQILSPISPLGVTEDRSGIAYEFQSYTNLFPEQKVEILLRSLVHYPEFEPSPKVACSIADTIPNVLALLWSRWYFLIVTSP